MLPPPRTPAALVPSHAPSDFPAPALPSTTLSLFLPPLLAIAQVPSGILNPNAMCLVGNGVVMHLPGFFAEIDKLEEAGVKARGARSRPRLIARRDPLVCFSPAEAGLDG